MTKFPVDKFQGIQTPFYYYDMEVLAETISALKKGIEKVAPAELHYAVKANADAGILECIAKAGLGADCVSGGEIKACINAGFPASKIVYAGVGKADWEIRLGLEEGIFSFNVESREELAVINEIASEMGKVARVAFRINPNVGAHTHKNITTGLEENKFGINMEDMVPVIKDAMKMDSVEVIGLHFHIGSQILDMSDFRDLSLRCNTLMDELESEGIKLPNLNLGGGLGVSYVDVDNHLIPAFDAYFETFLTYLKRRPGQTLHFELGRCMVAQCGSLITKVLYVKHATKKKFAIVDAGMTDLIRPALYQAHHQIDNISCKEGSDVYDVVGPICESTDVFAEQETLPVTSRGDFLALRSAGAYGQIMASQYNCRALPKAYYSDRL